VGLPIEHHVADHQHVRVAKSPTYWNATQVHLAGITFVPMDSAEAQERAKKLAAEKEFYVKKPMPKKLQDDIKSNDVDLKVQQDALAAKQKESGEINAKYDEDKRRYLELTGAKPKTASPQK